MLETAVRIRARATRRWTVLPAAALAALAAGLVSGCGSASVDPIAQAAQTTGGAPGVDFSLTSQAGVGGVAQNIAFTGTGTEDIRNHRVALTMDLSHILGAAHVTGVNPATAKINGVFAYPWFYMSAPTLFRGLPAGKQWIGFNVQAAAQSKGVNLGQLAQLNQSDPSQYLQALEATSGSVQRIGTETVRGTPTTHYHATVDLRRLPDRLPSSQRASASQSADRLVQLTGQSTYPVDVWIDAHHYVRREHITMTIKPNAQTGAPATSFGETIEFFNFGPKPAIQSPPASQVYDITSLAGGQQTP